jgi:SAM-dependent methyltransferase
VEIRGAGSDAERLGGGAAGRAGGHMRRFWDARAREDAFYFVDNNGRYRHPDLERFWRQGERDLDELLAVLGVRIWPGDTVIDLGCGVGRLTRALASRAAWVKAIDVSPEMLGRAEALNGHLRNVEWCAGDGVSLRPLEDEDADGLLSHVVFQHLPDPAIAYGYVAEIGRVLRPGGWAGIQVSDDPAIHTAARAPGRVAALLGRAPRGQRDRAWLGAAIDLAELRGAAESAGLEVTRVVGERT